MSNVDDDDPLLPWVNEFLERAQRGEQPKIDEFCRRVPEHAEELAELLHALDVLHDLKPESGVALSRVNADLPQKIGDYQIIGEIGRGGMGVVYEAEQESLGRRVALKVLPTGQLDSESAQLRFKREARAAAKMHHTNIVPVFEVGQDGGHFFYAMQLIDGQGLDQIIDELKREGAEKPDPHLTTTDVGSQDANETGNAVSTAWGLSQSQATANIQSGHDSQNRTGISTRKHFYRTVSRLASDVADALAFAHGRGVIHRDIKPSNVMLDMHGVPWVTDFGLAKTLEDDATLTKSGDYLGTLRYMSPERFRGQCDERADIYALGLTLYELLLLTPAYEAADRIKLIYLINNTEATRPRAIDPGIPRDLETIILKCIEKDPAQRYPSASELADDLQRVIGDEPIRARRASTYERVVRWSRRNKGLASALGGIAALLILIAVGSVIFSVRQAGLRRSAELNEQLTLSALKTAQRDRDAAEAAQLRTDDTLEILKAKSGQLERSLYASEINLAGQGLGESATTEQLSKVTERWHPALASERNDRGGWEWYFLQSVVLEDVVSLSPGFWGASFSPDDSLVAAIEYVKGKSKNSIHIFDAQTGKVVRTLAGHSAGLKSVAWSRTTNMIASSSWDTTIRLWDGETGECLQTIDRTKQYPDDVTWDASGMRLATVERSTDPGKSQITVFHPDEKDLAPVSFECGSGSYAHLSFSPGGNRLVALKGYVRYDGITIWDAESGDEIEHIPDAGSVIWGTDGDSVAGHFVCRPTGEVDLIGEDRRTVTNTYRGLSSKAIRPFMSRDRTKVISGSADNTVRVWDYQSAELLRTFQRHRSDVDGVQEEQQGQRVLSIGLATHIWQPEPNHRSVFGSPHPDEMHWHPDSNRLAVIGGDQVRVLDLKNRSFVTAGSELSGICRWSPDGTLLAANRSVNHSGIIASNLRILDGVPTPHTMDFPIIGVVQDISWHPTGRKCLYSGTTDIHILDLDTGEFQNDVEGWRDGHSLYHSVAWNHANPNLIAYSFRNNIRIWDLQTRKHVATFQGHERLLSKIEWSPDGTHLASASADFTARVWSLRTGRELLRLSGHNNQVVGISWAPDGRRLATAGSDGTVRIWDTSDGRELLQLDDHNCEVLSVAWSPDGRKIASGSIRNKLIVWDASAAYAAEQALEATDSPSGDFDAGSPSEDGFFLSEVGLKLRSSRWTWSPPEPVEPEINSPDDDFEPCLSIDGLMLVFHSDRPGGLGGNDLWSAKRESTDGPWQLPANLGSIFNSSGNDESPELSADGLTLYFASDRDGGRRDLWFATRETVSSEWSRPTKISGAINSEADDIEPSVSPDGLTMMFASSRQPRNGIFDIWMSIRVDVNDDWGEPVHLPGGINTDGWQGSPSLIGDGFGSTMVFHSGQGGRIASRVAATDPFVSAESLDPDNVLDGVNSPFLRSDGSSLWFRRIDRETGKYDLWFSRRVRK